MNKSVREFLSGIRLEARNRQLNHALRRWLPYVPIPDIECHGQTVVFNTVRSSPGSFHLYTDLFIGHLLARVGCRAIVLLDDGILAHWDTAQHFRTAASVLNPMHAEHQGRVMKRNAAALYEVFKAPGLELRWYSQVLADAAEEEIDADVECYALASTLRHFESGFFQPDDKEQQAYYQLSVNNAKMSKAIGRYVVEHVRPDLFATSHGIYSTWGPAYSYVKRAGIRTTVYAHHPYHLGGLMIDDAPGGALDREALEHYLRSSVFPERNRAVAQAYLDTRYSHLTSDTKEYFGNTASHHQLLSQPPDTAYQRTFGLFPNVAWDAIGDHLMPIFPNVIDWICETVRVIGEERRHRLIVRFHPAEVTRLKGTLLTEQVIREQVPDIDKHPNVVLMAASKKVNSYDLLRDEVDVALVYTGTLGAEAQPLGVPVVSAASGRFSQQFVHIARARDEYFSILHDPAKVILDYDRNRKDIIESVLKYHYYISEELFFPVAVLSRKGRHVVGTAELGNRATVDRDGLAKTLKRFLGRR